MTSRPVDQEGYCFLVVAESIVSSTPLIAFKKCSKKFDLHTICSFVY